MRRAGGSLSRCITTIHGISDGVLGNCLHRHRLVGSRIRLHHFQSWNVMSEAALHQKSWLNHKSDSDSKMTMASNSLRSTTSLITSLGIFICAIRNPTPKQVRTVACW